MLRKQITLLFLTMVTMVALTAAGEDYKFPPEVTELIARYEGTEAPVLPEKEAITEFDDETSFAPGRLHLPVNIIINKRKTRLYVVNAFGDTLAHYPVCCSRNRGQKKAKDDSRTPEGTFTVVGIYNSTDWTYKDTGQKCYGPYFVSLHTPGFYGIGIHGTNAPGSIPGRSSHGCIRMYNDDIRKVKQWVTKDSRVTILPDDPDDAKKAEKAIKEAYVGPQGGVVTTTVAEAESTE